MILKEKLNSLSQYGMFPNILPPCAILNSTNDVLTTTLDLSGAIAFDITMIADRVYNVRTHGCGQWKDATHQTGFLIQANTQLEIGIQDGTDNCTAKSPILGVNGPTGLMSVRVIYNGAGAANADKLKAYINGIAQVLSFTNNVPAACGATATPFTIGKYYYFMTNKMYYFSVSKNGGTASQYYFRGIGAYEYDLSSNALHATWAGTGARLAYHQEGNLRPARLGYSLWKKAGSANIHVPFNLLDAPISLTAGVNIPAGYVKDSDVVGNTSNYNLANGLINFDPNGTTDPKLDIFDKSNATIHIATGSMTYYNALYKYGWLVSELLDYATYNAYFNAAYQDRLFVKIEGGLLKDILNFKAKQIGTALAKAKGYCGIT